MKRRVLLFIAALGVAGAFAGCDSLPLWMVWQQRASIADHQHFDEQPLARAATPRPLPEAPAALQWPGGASAEQVDRWAAEKGTVALLVLRRGERCTSATSAATRATAC